MRDVRCVLCTFSHLVVLLLRFVVGGQMIWILWEYVDMDNFALRWNMQGVLLGRSEVKW